ncbi:MAG: hypothetical protein Q9M91_06875 [Candidatus Dojkabacteria bacterium]|nr:hypothetical protein [Candidatus Dojkabacteria bacterium]MDQ7021517.1 hypothetical protein [Candidatus Dojkabacteria bacterium]
MINLNQKYIAICKKVMILFTAIMLLASSIALNINNVNAQKTVEICNFNTTAFNQNHFIEFSLPSEIRADGNINSFDIEILSGFVPDGIFVSASVAGSDPNATIELVANNTTLYTNRGEYESDAFSDSEVSGALPYGDVPGAYSMTFILNSSGLAIPFIPGEHTLVSIRIHKNPGASPNQQSVPEMEFCTKDINIVNDSAPVDENCSGSNSLVFGELTGDRATEDFTVGFEACLNSGTITIGPSDMNFNGFVGDTFTINAADVDALGNLSGLFNFNQALDFNDLYLKATSNIGGVETTIATRTVNVATSAEADVPDPLDPQVLQQPVPVAPVEPRILNAAAADLNEGCCTELINTSKYDLCMAKQPFDTANEGEFVLCNNCIEQGGIWIAIGCLDVTPLGIVTGMIRIAFGVMGGVALIQLILAGLMYQSGQEAKITEAREKFFATLAGLAVLVFSVVILRIIGINVLDVIPDGSI